MLVMSLSIELPFPLQLSMAVAFVSVFNPSVAFRRALMGANEWIAGFN